MSPSAASPCWVLDTNVVLDWLLFADPSMLRLTPQIERGSVRWIYSAAMLDETLDVVGRSEFRRWGSADALQAAVQHCYCTHGELRAAASAPALRCRDADDQMFIDLALQHRVALLLSRDKALLELARPAAARGLRIARPAQVGEHLSTVPLD